MNPVRRVPGSKEAAVPATGAESVSHHGAGLYPSHNAQARPAHVQPATHCAGLRSASALVRCPLIPGTVPVREDRLHPHLRPCPLTPLGRPGPGRGGRLPTALCLSLSGSGSLRSPSPCAAKARHPHRTRPPSRPRSTSFRVLGHLETQRLVPASRPVPISTSSPAPPSSL